MAALWEAVWRLFPPLRVRTKLFSMMAILVVYGLVVSLVIQLEHLPNIEWGAESAVVNGIGLSFLIAFRTNHAYDRWWEARKLWGQLINETRNLCLKIRTLADVDAGDRQCVASLIADFGDVLKDHLRGRAGSDEPPSQGAAGSAQVHEPARLAGAIYEYVAGWHRRGQIDGWTLLWLDAQAKSLMDICGACERIRNTPLSSSYRALLRHAIAIYLAVAPFYLMEDTGIAGFPLFVLAAYFLLGIELVAEEIEEPFGAGGDNLPLEQYCATIAQSVHQIIATTSETAREKAAKPSPSGSSAGDLE
ncbi:MAG: bestrophin family protein [Isosphaeraceae bacterium]